MSSSGRSNSSSSSSSASPGRMSTLPPLQIRGGGSGMDTMMGSPRSVDSGASKMFSPSTSPYSDYGYGYDTSAAQYEDEYQYSSSYGHHGRFRAPSHSETMQSNGTASTVRPLLRHDREMDEEVERKKRAEAASKREAANRKKMNAHSYCGRHGDEFLTKGWGDLWRGFTGKRE